MKKEVTNLGLQLKQVNKQQAKKAYEKGECVHVIPCNASRTYGEIRKDGKLVQYGAFWGSFEKEYTPDSSFEELVNEHMFYTPRELGRYLNYYVSI